LLFVNSSIFVCCNYYVIMLQNLLLFYMLFSNFSFFFFNHRNFFVWHQDLRQKKIKGEKRAGVVRTKFCGNHGDFQIFFFQFFDFY
jgi:hypothetical protein